MTKQAHTPGPWRIAYGADNQSSVSVQTKDGKRICACRYNWRLAGAYEKARADAALIAASPALLEALKDAQDDLESAKEQIDADDTLGAWRTVNDVLASLRSAIALAEPQS